MATKYEEGFDRAPQPVVFMFQPTRFEIVPNERLEEWEKLLRQNVGLHADLDLASLHETGTCCVSCCPDCDDCDQD